LASRSRSGRRDLASGKPSSRAPRQMPNFTVAAGFYPSTPRPTRAAPCHIPDISLIPLAPEGPRSTFEAYFADSERNSARCERATAIALARFEHGFGHWSLPPNRAEEDKMNRHGAARATIQVARLSLKKVIAPRPGGARRDFSLLCICRPGDGRPPRLGP